MAHSFWLQSLMAEKSQGMPLRANEAWGPLFSCPIHNQTGIPPILDSLPFPAWCAAASAVNPDTASGEAEYWTSNLKSVGKPQ